ncbi:MAG TPA: LysR family transcriptional regulator, partial [Mycobacterium sp.]|nr:LysR family transcriptional regulator [Mycobacterium sp.]
ARRLHVSQSALSQTVRSLERQLGLQLLIRDHTGARPTEAGDLLLREARPLIAHYDQMMSAVSGPSGLTAGHLRIGVPLEFPVDLLPNALAQLAVDHPDTRVELLHSASAAQLFALRAGALDVALVRDRPADSGLDAVLAVQESMGVILTTARSAELAEPSGVQLHRLAGLDWIAFARSDSPAWYDQVAATLRGHGVTVADRPDGDDRPVIAEVKLAAAGTGRAFAFASPGWAQPLPEGLVWHPLIGHPIVRRTWAVWLAAARKRDLATFISILEATA